MTEKKTAKPKAKPKSSKKKKKVNLIRLYSEMNKLAEDAVDKEVIKRFKTMVDSIEEDITKVSLSAILKEPKNVDVYSFHDGLQPYIKHYLFMLKRSKKKK